MPARTKALLRVLAPVEVRYVPLAPMVRAPVPIGPLAKAGTTPVAPSRVATLVLAPTARPPAFTATPPPKRLAPESWSRPLPDLVMPTVALSVELPIGAETARVGVTFATVVLPLTVTGLTLNVRVAPPRSRTMMPPAPATVAPVPESVETVPTLPEIAVMPPVKVSTPVPVVTLGAVEPPSLSNVSPARVWLKLLSCRIAYCPRTTGVIPKLIWLAWSSRTLPPLMIRESATVVASGIAEKPVAPVAPVTFRSRMPFD